ncbi:MAG: endoglucanase [Bacteroides sp.]|nr:endoglucanase [Bacteroides sp.]
MRKGLWLLCSMLLFGYNAMAVAQGKTKSYRGDDAAVRYTGRTLTSDAGTVTFDWVGTYLETRFTGGNLSIRLTETKKSYYDVFVDGELHRVVTACGTDTLINFVSGVSKRQHSLRIQKRSEGEFGKTTIQQFVLPASGSLQEEPKTRTRHIEFIGDSWTCGYGTEGKDRSEPFKVETENCHWAYAMQIARYFDADYTLIAHSGRGAVRNYGDSVRVSAISMKNKMQLTFDEGDTLVWDFKRYRPDMVIINLGINDFSTEPHPYRKEFVAGYKQILSQIRQNYGDVPVLCLYPSGIHAPVYAYYEDAVKSMDDARIFLLRMNEDLMNNTSDLGAGWHPGYSGHRKIAMSVVPYVATIMDWELPLKEVK